MPPRPITIALYGDVNLNIIDGSAIWVQSLCETLHAGERTRTTLVLKAPEQRPLITGALRRLERLELVDPADLRRSPAAPLRPAQALDAIERLDRERRFDAVLLRGYALAQEAARRDGIRGRLWTYLTDIPQSVAALGDADVERLTEIAGASRRLLCQTEDLRAFLEAVVPPAGPKLALLPPMIPPHDVQAREAPPLRRFLYAGKFAPLWGFAEMCDAFAEVRAAHPGADLVVVGDKIHEPPDDPGFRPEVERRLRDTPGLVWRGGLARAEVAGLLREGGVALSYRDPAMNESLELSTKILEYGAAGLAVILNRTPMHERLLGPDYPLFVEGRADLAAAMRAALEDPERRARAADACRIASAAFTSPRVYELIRPALERLAPRSDDASVPSAERLRVTVAGHDLKFFDEVRGHFDAFRSVEIREDRWPGHEIHDESLSRSMLIWADVVVCEWCLGNAVWYSTRRGAGQRLVVRVHRAEMETHFPSLIEIDQVDAMVFVSPRFLERAVERFGWPRRKLRVIPNSVDCSSLDRPKLAGAGHTLGMLGFVPKRKRLDRALDILEHLRAEDPRYRLSVKGRFPWELDWVWRLEHERAYFEAQLARIHRSPLLREAVSFEGHGPDVSSWFRSLGHVVSTSDDESFHVAVAEGMASRAVPAVLAWDGAAEIYPRRWVHSSPAGAARSILAGAATWRAQGEAARAHVLARFDTDVVMPLWEDVILGEGASRRPRARAS